MTTDQLKRQLIRSIVDELDSRIAVQLTDPTAQASLLLVKRMLACLATEQWPASDMSMANPQDVRAAVEFESTALERADQGETSLLAPMGGERPTASLPVSQEDMQAYLRTKLPGGENVRVAKMNASLGGFSKDTYIVHLEGGAGHESVVIRRDVDGGPVESSAADEFPVLRDMFAHGVPVAEPLWADHNTPFGGGVVVTGFKPGKPAFDYVADALSAEGQAAALSLASVLAQVHRVPLSDTLNAQAKGSLSVREHVLGMVESLEDQWQRRRLWSSEILQAGFDWLKTHVPESDQPATVVHGDASLRNLLCNAGEPTGLLDWELWHIGDPCEDLAYARGDVERSISWDQFLNEYRAHGGPARYTDAANEYFGLWASLRNAVLSGCCGHGFAHAKGPQTRMLYAGLVAHRNFVRDVARRLSTLMS